MTLKYFNANLKAVKQEGGAKQKVFSFLASSSIVDRDRDILLAEGADIVNYKENPVFLWAHSYREFPIGKAVKITKGKDGLFIDVVFADTEEGKKAEYLYENGFLNAVSVGFLVRKYVPVPEDEQVTSIEVEVSGKKRTIDLTQFPTRPRVIISDWELLEVSAVPVPANPQALIQNAATSLAQKFHIPEEEVKEITADLVKQAEEIYQDLKIKLETFIKGVVPSHSTPINFDLNWDKARARANIARWASRDGSGDKESINWAKYAKAFAWFDSERRENFTAYKLPHHDIVDGRFVAIWRGITTAMATLLGARGGVDVPDEDRKGVWRHLARHYRDADREPPPLEREYTPEELKAIEEDRWPLKEETPEPAQPAAQPEPVPDPVLEEIKALKHQLLELEETLQVRLRILESIIEEKLPQPDQDKQTEPAGPDNDLLDKAFQTAWDLAKKLSV